MDLHKHTPACRHRPPSGACRQQLGRLSTTCPPVAVLGSARAWGWAGVFRLWASAWSETVPALDRGALGCAQSQPGWGLAGAASGLTSQLPDLGGALEGRGCRWENPRAAHQPPVTPPAHLFGAQGVAAGVQRGPGRPQAFLDRRKVQGLEHSKAEVLQLALKGGSTGCRCV